MSDTMYSTVCNDTICEYYVNKYANKKSRKINVSESQLVIPRGNGFKRYTEIYSVYPGYLICVVF